MATRNLELSATDAETIVVALELLECRSFEPQRVSELKDRAQAILDKLLED